MLGSRMHLRDDTDLTGPRGHWPCDGGAGISHIVVPRDSSTLHWTGLAVLWSRTCQRICTSIGCEIPN